EQLEADAGPGDRAGIVRLCPGLMFRARPARPLVRATLRSRRADNELQNSTIPADRGAAFFGTSGEPGAHLSSPCRDGDPNGRRHAGERTTDTEDAHDDP